MESRAYDPTTESSKINSPTPGKRDEPIEIYHKHPNGGGFVASGARVGGEVYVGPDAAIRGNAIVIGPVRLEQNAVIDGDAYVEGRVLMRHSSRITGSARVTGRVTLLRHAYVGGNATVTAVRGSIMMDYYAHVSDFDCVVGHFLLE